MDTIRQYAKDPRITGIVGLILGLILGLFVLGWWLWPVEWTEATPAQLSLEWKTEFLRMSVAGYSQNGDALKAQERFSAVGEGGEVILGAILQDPQGLNESVILEYKAVVGADQVAVEPTKAAEAESGGSSTLLLVLLFVLLVVLVAFVVYFFLMRKRMTLSGIAAPIQHTPEVQSEPAVYSAYPTSNEETPIAQFMASYKFGDDLFDDSFTIDSASGEFLGECGVGISETIGVGEHKKVTAFEVWLFDKNDIQTVTKVLMSAHAFNDPTIRQRLEAKGEPVLFDTGMDTVLDTQTLQLVARVVDMDYGNGMMPEESYFDHIVLELAVWIKPQ
jgi:hypothetical protein